MTTHTCLVGTLSAQEHEWQFAAVGRQWVATERFEEPSKSGIVAGIRNIHHHETLCYRHCVRCGLVQQCQFGKPWTTFNQKEQNDV